MTAKISDLGVATILNENYDRNFTPVPGTVAFMPPEAMITSPQYDTCTDVLNFVAGAVKPDTNKPELSQHNGGTSQQKVGILAAQLYCISL